MIDIKKMKPKEWNPIKEDLEGRLKDNWSFSRILRTDKGVIYIEGGGIIVSFDIVGGRAYVHNKCAKYSGGYIEIDKVTKVKEILKEWAKANFEEGELQWQKVFS